MNAHLGSFALFCEDNLFWRLWCARERVALGYPDTFQPHRFTVSVYSFPPELRADTTSCFRLSPTYLIFQKKMKRRWSEHRSTALTVSGERQVPLADSFFFSHECAVSVWRHFASHSQAFSLPDLWQSLCLMALVLATNSAKVKSQAISSFQSSLPLDAPCH